MAREITERRRAKQDAFNREHGIVPKTVIKSVRDVIDLSGDKGELPHSQKALSKRSGRLHRQAGEGDAGGVQASGIRVRRRPPRPHHRAAGTWVRGMALPGGSEPAAKL